MRIPGIKVRIFTPFVLTKKTPNGLRFHAHVPFVAGMPISSVHKWPFTAIKIGEERSSIRGLRGRYVVNQCTNKVLI